MIKIIDNFYNDPSFVIKLAENNYDLGGCSGSSMRSLPLQQIDQLFYNDFCDIVCSMYNIPRQKVCVDTFLSKQNYDGIHGMPHIDGRSSSGVSNYETYNLLVAGQIFLSEQYDTDSGITFYQNNYKGTDKERFDFAINACYKEKNSMIIEDYKSHLKNYLNSFQDDVVVKNKFNRFVSWSGGSIHCSNMTEKQQTKLIQSFYISVV